MVFSDDLYVTGMVFIYYIEIDTRYWCPFSTILY